MQLVLIIGLANSHCKHGRVRRASSRARHFRPLGRVVRHDDIAFGKCRSAVFRAYRICVFSILSASGVALLVFSGLALLGALTSSMAALNSKKNLDKTAETR